MECIPVWNRCNNKCLMCSNPRDYASLGSYSLQALKARVRRFSRDEKDIYLTGGEPTMHPQILELLAFIRERLPEARIIIDTNGRMFSYPAFAARCAAVGNIEFQVSICGFDAASHDGVTLTPGSFSQTVAGIRNLLALGRPDCTVEARFVLSALSAGNMLKVYRFVRANLAAVRSLVFIFLEMEGMASVNSRRVGLRYPEASRLVQGFFRKVKKPPFEIKLYHFPLCTLPVSLWKYAWRTLPDKEIIFPRLCRPCKVRKWCLGVHGDYPKHYGTEDFSPVRKLPRLVTGPNPCRPILSAEEGR